MESEKIREYLLNNADIKYKEFQSKLIPNVSKETVIGVKIPVLRKIAKYLSFNYENYDTKFLKYREEILIYGFFIGYKKIDILSKLKLFDDYLKYANSWETVDTVIFGVKDFEKEENKGILFKYFSDKINSQYEFVKRAGVVGFTRYLLDSNYIKEVAKIVENIEDDRYYVNMAISWCIAEILAHDFELGKSIILSGKLSEFVRAKSIQKALESYKVCDSDKTILRGLKD